MVYHYNIPSHLTVTNHHGMNSNKHHGSTNSSRTLTRPTAVSQNSQQEQQYPTPGLRRLEVHTHSITQGIRMLRAEEGVLPLAFSFHIDFNHHESPFRWEDTVVFG